MLRGEDEGLEALRIRRNVKHQKKCTDQMGTRVQSRPGALQAEKCADGRRRLLREIRVDVSRKVNKSEIITVPTDFVTDYSSLPWGTRWLMHWSRVDVAGVVHDYLYRCGAGVPSYTKAHADRIWRSVALSGDRRAWWHQAWLGWIALRLFGWRSFRRRDVRAYTDEPTASRKCPRRWTTRLAHILVLVALPLSVLALVLTLPRVPRIWHWLAEVYRVLRELSLQSALVPLLPLLVLLWILPSEERESGVSD